ncbi:MAG TPA: FecR domain-containing protein [Polyangia bacterium]|nr:FecR domain-containing protein [Polyangia bacterium]
MPVDNGTIDHEEEALIGRAVRGALSTEEKAALERHLAGCPTCSAELEAVRIFAASVAAGPLDEALDDAAVEHAMARLGATDEALDHAAVERAMAHLDVRTPAIATPPRRLRRTIGFAAFGAAAAAAVMFAVFRTPGPATTAGRVAAPAPSRPLVLADGSEVAPDDAATTIQVGEQTAARTVVRLPSGAARFHVRHDSRRVFRVDAGPVQIDDIGTVFRVAHETGGRVRVAVSEGRVAVLSSASGARVELGAGDERVFPASAEAAQKIDNPAEAPVAPPADLPAASASQRGQPRARLADDPTGLLASADVARRSHQPKAAVAPLRRLVEHYPKDPRTPSAAFTLGWVLLTDLNQPREAAAWFALAERIAPRGALAEDAAARVAEAWQKAGESRRAAEAARHYEQMYPTGRYIALMRGLIGKH